MRGGVGGERDQTQDMVNDTRGHFYLWTGDLVRGNVEAPFSPPY